MVVWSGTTSPSTSPSTIRTDYQDLCEPEPTDSRPKGGTGSAKCSCVKFDRPAFVAPIRRCLAGGHGGLDARLGALIVPVPPRGEAKPCSDGCRVTRAIVRVSRDGLGPSEERRPVSEPSWVRRRRSRATPWRRPAATLDAGRRRSYTVSTQSRMRSSRFGWPLGEHPRYQGG